MNLSPCEDANSTVLPDEVAASIAPFEIAYPTAFDLGGAFPQPFAAIEAKKGGVKTLFTSKTAVPFDEVLMTVLFREEFMQKNPAAVRAFLADLVASTKWYLANTRAARQALIDAKFVRTPPEVYLDSQDSYRDPACRIDIAAMNKMQDMQVELGFQKDKVDVTKVVDLSWLPK